MKKFNVEHVGICVREPVRMAEWYRDALGFNVTFSAQSDDGGMGVAFLTDHSGQVMFELAKVPEVSPLCDRTDHHLQLHLAMESDDPDDDASYLVEHGAVFIEKCPLQLPGDYLVVLHDPWGNCVQFVKRATTIKP